MIAVLAWIYIQTQIFTPTEWHADIWKFVSPVLGKPVAGAVSLNPFVTKTELMKLMAYVTAGLLAAALSLKHDNAHALLVTIVIVATVYSAYGICLSVFHTSQVTLLEGSPPPYDLAVSGGLVAKNSFATFTGMGFLACLSLLVEAGRHRIVASRGWRTLIRTFLQFGIGNGVAWIIASLILLGALIGSQSRAGLIATLTGLVGMFALNFTVGARRGNAQWTMIGGAATAFTILVLFLASGHSLAARFEDLIETRGAGEMRPLMWDVAIRSIAENPYLGTGLGTYSDVFSLHAKNFVPFVVDRAHNDWLEFAMGVGIPAATLWTLALLVLVAQCTVGALRRYRRRVYAVTAVGASLLVAFHSFFDFSLQMPAVGILFAVILGVGIGQAQTTREVEASVG